MAPGHYYCENIGDGDCELREPGCGAAQTYLNFRLDGTILDDGVPESQSVFGEDPLSSVTAVSTLIEKGASDREYRRGCRGWILDRTYSPALAKELRKSSRSMVL